MKKILAVLFACSIVLAGCMDLTDEDIDSIVDAIVEIPGCNADETAYNYDVNATNNNACLTETVLKDSIADFIVLMDNGPSADQTMGMTMEGTDDSWQDQQLNWVSVNAYSPNGVYTSMEIDNSGFTMWSQSQLITAAEDGTTLIQVDWNGERMLMNSATQYSTWNSMDMDDDDDMDMNNNMVMGDMETPEVEIPDTFDPSTALFEAGLATDNGYAFSTIMDDGMGYSMTMTFTLGMDLVVNSMTLTETMGDESSTSSITMLGDYALRSYLTISTDTTIPYQALPFGTTPMNGMDNADDDCDDECDDDEIDWESYNDGYCAWEGNSDDGENVWSCKFDESDNSWDTWWYYCELHEGDWHCTDDFGQSSVYENSADLNEYDAHAGHDHGDDDHDNHDGHDDHSDDGHDNHDGHDDHGDDGHDGHDDDDDDDLITPEQLLADIDSDESGTMSLDEFNAFFGGSDEIDINDPEFSEMFDNNDADASGDLDNSELEGFIMDLDAYLEGGHDEEDHDGHGDDDHDDHDGHNDHGDDGHDDHGDDDGPPTAQDLINMTDTDDSGTLSFDEFIAFMNSPDPDGGDDDHDDDESLPQSVVDDLSAIFDNNDADNSDDLDLNELDQFILDTDDYFTSMDGNDDDHDDDLITPEQLLDDVDSDESGTMSLDEFNAFFGGSDEVDINDPEFSEMFDNNDADASGDLDNNELEGFILELDAYLEGGHDGDHSDHDDDHSGPHYYENCQEGEGLSSYNCWNNDWDVDGDGIPEDSDSYWNYECQQLEDGFWECMTDHINYYDHCVQDDHPSYYECWLDEWDTDNDGAYNLGSDDYEQDECEQLEDGSWACSHHDEMEMFQIYDYCSDESGMYECWNNEWIDSDGNVVMTDDYELEDCSELEDSTWECALFDDDHDDNDGHDDGDHSDFYVDAYLTDNWAGGLNDYAPPEFRINSGFSDVDNVQFELYDSDGMELTTLNIQPSDFTDQGDGSMIYYVDMDNLMLDVGCYTLTATVTSYDNNYEGEWTREDICIYDSGNDDNSDDHVSMFDWIIVNTQTDMPIEGSFDDYSIILALCDMDESNSDAPTMTCGDDILKVTIADAMAQGAVVMFHDADMSGTISSGDMVHISPDIDLDGDWNMVRLYSTSADSYSDENPMLTPGFSSMIGIVALLGAALLTRRD